jgi:hypothetical protein
MTLDIRIGHLQPGLILELRWQAHTVRGSVSILGSKGGEKIESSKTLPGSVTIGSRNSSAVRSASQTPRIV